MQYTEVNRKNTLRKCPQKNKIEPMSQDPWLLDRLNKLTQWGMHYNTEKQAGQPQQSKQRLVRLEKENPALVIHRKVI